MEVDAEREIMSQPTTPRPKASGVAAAANTPEKPKRKKQGACLQPSEAREGQRLEAPKGAKGGSPHRMAPDPLQEADPRGTSGFGSESN